jgi:phenylacetate-CoA ligase
MSFSENLYNKSPLFFQSLFLNGKAFELYFERYGKKFTKIYKEFEKHQWLSESELIEYQNELLEGLINYAYHHVSYYNKLMRMKKLHPRDIKTIDDLPKLPVLTKEIIKNNYKNLISDEFHGYRLKHGHTSGTTGSPLDVCYNVRTCVVHHVADWRQKNWAGLKYGQPYASLQGRVIVPLRNKKPPFWRKNYINNQLFLSSFHLTEKNIPYYLEQLNKSNIKYLEGYPSTLYILALYLKKYSQTFSLKAVLTSSETLLSYQRELLERVFCCKVFNFYGMAERAVFATECEHHSGLHLNSDYGITEFLDDSHQPTLKHKMGRIVATSLHNIAMPIIRYQTNDIGSLKKNMCGCGRGFQLMDDITTKNESIVTMPDGRLISPSVLTHPFKPMYNIIESQIIQKTLDHLMIKIVKSQSFTPRDEEKLLSEFKKRLGSDIRISIDYVKKIPRTKNGKFKWVISNIKPIF